jgi:hypothetical protein
MEKWHASDFARVFPGFVQRERKFAVSAGVCSPALRMARRVVARQARRKSPCTANEWFAPRSFVIVHMRRAKAASSPILTKFEKTRAWPVDPADRSYAPMSIIEAYVDAMRRAQGKPTYAEIRLGAPDFEAQLKDFAKDVFKAMGAGTD